MPTFLILPARPRHFLHIVLPVSRYEHVLGLKRLPDVATLPVLWEFEQLNTLRHRMIQRAGRLIRPQRKLTLSMASNDATENDRLQILEATPRAA